MPQSPLQLRLHSVIFGTETPAGKRFDVLLIACILLSVLAMLLETVSDIDARFGGELLAIEWFFTIVFTVEYGTRIYCSPNRSQYLRSFYGVVDLLAILPSYLGLFLTGFNYLLIVRLLRVLRIFRVFKLMRYLREANVLVRAIVQSRRKVGVFFSGGIGRCHYLRFSNVCRRGTREWFYQYSQEYLLDHSDHYYGGLW